MRTAHGFMRLVSFSDGVVAIAITLLILPLVESVTEANGNIGAFMSQHAGQLFAFVLSFAVIGNFWVVHHQMYEKLTGYTRGLLWLNLLWLMSIVFLPFPTALVANAAESPTTHILYIGTMVLTTAAGLAQQIVIVRHPEIQAEEVRGRLEVLTYASTVVIMVIALVIALAIPAIGLWSLLLLFAATPAEHAIRRLRLKGAAR
jgi:uncharacterized membrane protein